MAPAARNEWLKAAATVLHELDSDLLRRGVRKAMETADHPSKIVPAVMAAIGEDHRWRQRYRAEEAERKRLFLAPPPVPRPAPVSDEEIAAIYAEVGLHRAPDPDRPQPRQQKSLRIPTAQDYAAMGFAPDVAAQAAADARAAAPYRAPPLAGTPVGKALEKGMSDGTK